MGSYLTGTGLQRLAGPPLGAPMVGLMSRREALIIAGLLVMASAFHAWRQAESEKVDGRYPTFAEKERFDLATRMSDPSTDARAVVRSERRAAC